MKTVIEALQGTPWWVYLIFLYLLWIGIKASKTRVVSLKKMFIAPVLFFIWSIYNYTNSPSKIGICIIGIVVGGCVGWVINKRLRVRVEKDEGTMTIPGTWTTLILVMVIFAVKYYINYSYAVAPKAKMDPAFYVPDLVISGFITGMFAGRIAALWQKFRSA